MKSTKCSQCGFVGWSDVEYCKACGALLGQAAYNEPASQKKGLAIFSLVLGIISFFTFGLLGLGAITGIILAAIAMSRVKREPWKYGGRGMAITGLVLSITSLATGVPVGIVAAIAIPNLLAARMAANEGSAIHSLRTIYSAEMTFQSQFNRYATLQELGAQNLIDQKLASGVKNGYRFTVELTTADRDGEGFAVSGVPTEYRSSGRRSFYVDETFVIRAADNQGAPSSTLDAPVDTTPVRGRYRADDDL